VTLRLRRNARTSFAFENLGHGFPTCPGGRPSEPLLLSPVLSQRNRQLTII